MNKEIKNKVSELVMIAGLNTAHDYDGIENEEDVLLYLNALIRHYKSFPVELPVKPACETKLLKTLERVIKYYSDLQTESPDNLSLGRFHLNMEILIEQFEEHLSKSA